jgi:hypothetical protein
VGSLLTDALTADTVKAAAIIAAPKNNNVLFLVNISLYFFSFFYILFA